MTTIAVKDGVIAADSLIDISNTCIYHASKLIRLGKSIFADAGEDCTEVARLYEWIEGGRKRAERPEFGVAADFHVVELSPDGVFLWDRELRADRVHDGIIAVGSGYQVALYCLRHLGMSAADAVREACRVDPYSAPPVFWASLKGEEGLQET